MNTCGTQYSRESHLTSIHHNGIIFYKPTGVDFRSTDPQLCRLDWNIDYAGLIEKLTPKVQVEGDEREIVRIIYRYPTMGDDNTVYFSAMDIQNDEDVQVMLESHDMVAIRVALKLYVETERTVAGILRRFPLPGP